MLAIGLVVDDAIVVLENIVRRMEQGAPALIAAIDGSKEIGFAVIATTLALAAVFLPISYIPGNIGRLFGEFGISVAASILFSALIALTLTPMLASVLFTKGIKHDRVTQGVDTAFNWLSEPISAAFLLLCGTPGWSLWLQWLSALGYGVFSTLHSEYTPADDRGMLFISITPPEGASIQYVDRYLHEVERIANRKSARHRKKYGCAAGVGGNNSGARVVLPLVDWSQRSESAQSSQPLRGKLSSLPGVRVNVITPTGLGGRISSQAVQFVLGGPSYEELVKWRDIVLARARENPGLINPDSDYDERKPQVKIETDRSRAADLGVSLDTVGRTLETMLGARKVTTYVDRGEEYNVMLQARSEDRATPSDLDNIYVRSDKTSTLIPLIQSGRARRKWQDPAS